MRSWKVLFGIIITSIACKKPYYPPAISSPNSYLVVEGVINSGSDSTIIKLSRTVNLSSIVTNNPLLHATITVQGDQNTSYALTETGNGYYKSAGLNLDNTHKYRLSINTSDNKQYLSNYVSVLNSPPIDSVNYVIGNSGLNIYSGTHDPTGDVKYYRWDFQETWIFHSNYPSSFKSNGDTVLSRDLFHDEIYICWQSDSSSTIILNSSAKLSQDVIANNLITSIASTSEKIGSEYSVLVRQYALTPDAYSFWTNLKKNTEQLGSIFDAQPSEITGNIHSVTNPSEAVIGYISVGSTSVKRIFINNQQLPTWLTTPAYPSCQLDSCLYVYYGGGKVLMNQVNGFINYNKGAAVNPLVPVQAITQNGAILGYTAAEPICVDCTLRGTNKEPSFWEY